jgi:hypothetical protein
VLLGLGLRYKRKVEKSWKWDVLKKDIRLDKPHSWELVDEAVHEKDE